MLRNLLHPRAYWAVAGVKVDIKIKDGLSANLSQYFFGNIGWRAKSQKSSNGDFRSLLLCLIVSMYKFKGKTPQSGCETKRIASRN